MLASIGAALVPGNASSPSALSKPASFSAPRFLAVAKYPEAVAIGDLNGDRKPDLVTASANGSVSNNASVLLNQGHGRFRSGRAYQVGLMAQSVAIGDLNGDGIPDLATSNLTGNSVSVLLSGGDGRFLPRVDYATDKRPWDVAIGDLNGDGRADLATANTDESFGGARNSVSILINNGDGTFRETIDHWAGNRPVSIAIADLNGDGRLDIVTANMSDRVSVLINRGAGDFARVISYPAGSGPRGIAVGDLNDDGEPDLVTANTNTTPSGDQVDGVSVLLNRGDGTFSRAYDYRVVNGGLAARGLGLVSVAVGDLNGDHVSDLAVGNDVGTVSVFVGRGNGRFWPRIDYKTGTSENGWGPRSVAIGDLDGDRRLDVAIVKSTSVSILLNRTH